MLLPGIFLCWMVALTHTFFRSPEGLIWIPWIFIFPILLAVPRLLYRARPALRRRVTPGWVFAMERIGLFGVLINIPGVLFFHVMYPSFQYDRFLHLAGAFAVFWWQALVLIPFPVSAFRAKVLLRVGLLTFIGLFAWEGYQWGQDQLFGAHTFFDYAQPIFIDFWEDISFGIIGLVAAMLVFYRTFPRYSSLRRS